MTHSTPRPWAALALLLLTVPSLATASGPIVVVTERHALRELQNRVDLLVGPGRVDVRRDFVGARPGDPDPWFWTNPGHPMELTLVERRNTAFEVGWYAETGTRPVLDGVDDACVLDGSRKRGDCVAFQLPSRVQRFGFYVLAPKRGDHDDDDDDDAQLTNSDWDSWHGKKRPKRDRFVKERQMLVYDISRWSGMECWLVACETFTHHDRDDFQHEDRDDDDDDERDYSDVVFVVSGGNVTPALKSTFGKVKQLYR